ncbi:hypothetical protein Gotur_017085, partial [Gossypium turneri]
MKVGFNLVTMEDTLWVQVLRLKYGWNSHIPESISRSQSLHLSHSLSKAWPLFHENLIWSVGNGSSIHCWKDSWVPGSGLLLSYVTIPNPLNSLFHSHYEGNWVHLFSDGAVARDFRNASVGGVVRDQFENWILGFNHYLGKCSPLEVELCGILDGVLILL